jgi:CelD/BcsL family acetyltransferase involved in cellulose biosynthesis
MDESRIPNLPRKRNDDSFEIVTDVEALEALEGEWDDLCGRSSQHRFSQSFVWCWTTWEAVEGPRGRRLLCIVARKHGRVVLIWPFIVYRKSYLLVAAPLGCSYSEYPDPLVEDGSEADQRVELAWHTLCNSCGCDLIKLRYVRSGSRLHRLILNKIGNKAKRVSRITNLYVSWHNCETWESYYRGLEAKDRRDNERRRRRLDEHGKVTFEVVEGAQCAPIIDWALNSKVKQLAQTNRRGGSWLKTKAYRNLLVWAAARSSPHGRLTMFVLKLNDQVIATLICRVDQVRVEALNTVYDAAYAKYAPGKILFGAVLNWTFEQRLDFDMRGGNDPYKKKWANRKSAAIGYEVTNSALYQTCLWIPSLTPFMRGYRLGKQALSQYLMEWLTKPRTLHETVRTKRRNKRES